MKTAELFDVHVLAPLQRLVELQKQGAPCESHFWAMVANLQRLRIHGGLDEEALRYAMILHRMLSTAEEVSSELKIDFDQILQVVSVTREGGLAGCIQLERELFALGFGVLPRISLEKLDAE
jgi:hypothetical protein